MNKTKIEWADYTWNPVVGCKTGCGYCYAKRMNDRFRFIENWDEPEFFTERLMVPSRIKKPSKIFVCSMADLFAPWIPIEWTWQILDVVRQFNQHEYMFLTKFSNNYLRVSFPKNCWLGMTITNESTANFHKLRILNAYQTTAKKFVSIEPIMGTFHESDFNSMDLVIVGAMTGPGAIIPQKEWIESIKHDNIFYKNNIKKYL